MVKSRRPLQLLLLAVLAAPSSTFTALKVAGRARRRAPTGTVARGVVTTPTTTVASTGGDYARAADGPVGEVSRRRALAATAATSLAGLAGLGGWTPAAGAVDGVQSPRMKAYEVLERDPPCLQPFKPRGEKRILRKLVGECNALVVGDHPASAQDHAFETDLVRRIAETRRDRLTLALAAFPASLQPAFDAFLDRDGTSDAQAEVQLRLACAEVVDRELVELHLPLLRLARSLKAFRLLAAGVDPTVLARVREGGLEKLTREERSELIDSPTGFVESVQQPGFKLYSDWVVQDQYERAQSSGELSNTTLANFFAGEILAHEAVAKRVADCLRADPDDFVVLLADLESTKFGSAVPSRLVRMGVPKGEATDTPSKFRVETIAINPTARDSLTPMKSLRLKLGYGRDQLEVTQPLARYLWFSFSPPPYLLTHMLDEIA